MCGGNSGPTSSGMNYGFQNSTATTTPDVNAYNYLLAGLATANNITGIPYQPYTGQLTAGFSQDQLAGMQAVREAQGAAQNYINRANSLASQAQQLSSPSNFSQAAVNQYMNPLMTSAINSLPVEYSQAAVNQYTDPRLQTYLNTAPLSYSEDAVSRYYNPYQQQVINATKAQIEQQNAQQMAQQQAEAIRSGAFGGDRTGAARAQLAGQQALSQNQVLGALRQQGYQNALSAFQQQQTQALGVAAQQQKDAQNMFAQQQAAGLNARQQSYAQAVAQYNQQQQQAVAANQAASYAIAQLGAQDQQARLQGAQALIGTGQLQQQMQQQQINQSYNQWLANQAYPYQQLQAYLNAAGLSSGLGGTTTSSSSGASFGNTAQSGTGSSLGQILGSAISGLGLFNLSDERAKTNIDYVGKDPSTGDKLYAYDYKSDVERSEDTGKPMPPKRVSPMAQEVAERNPEDVVDLGGLLGVKLGREGKAAGGSSQTMNMPPIYMETGEMSPGTGYADLSSIAYPTDPNLNIYKPSGLSALFSPQETYEKIKSKWVSEAPETEAEELKPFEVDEYLSEEDDTPRSKKAMGGSSEEDPSDFIAMSKYRPYGVTYNPKIATAISKAAPDINIDFPKTRELNYLPGLPGGKLDVKSPSMDDSGSKIGSKLGQLAKSGYSKLTHKEGEGANAQPSFLDKLKTNVSEGFGGMFSPEPVASDAKPEVAGGFDIFGGAEKMFKNLFNEGGRVPRPDGGPITTTSTTTPTTTPAPINFGNITGSQLGPVTNPFSSGTINNIPVGTGAFRTPINAGLSVRDAFGGAQGLGMETMNRSLAEHRLPWTAVNTGSPTYNQLLLRASQNVGPRQLTPQEFGLSAINTNFSNLAQSAAQTAADIRNAPTAAQIAAETNLVQRQRLQNQADLAALKARYPQLFITPTNYVYQPTNWLTPEGTYFMVPTSSYNSANYYVNPFQTTPPAFRAAGGAVKERYPLSSQYLDEPEQDLGSLAEGIYPAVREVAFGNPEPGMHVMQEKTLGFGPVEMSHGGRTGYATLGGVNENPDDFEKDVNQTIRFEGRGLVRDDAGAGPSKFGINKRANPDIDVENLNEADARRLYKERYWDKIGASELPENVRPMAYDTSVLMGPGRAKEFLQASGGDPEKFMGMRRSFLNNLVEQNPSKYGKYAKSWENRNNELMGNRPVAMASAPSGVVAKDRGDEDTGVDTSLVSKASASGDAAPTVSASDSGEGGGLFGMKPFMNPDLAMFLLSTGAGMAASRSRSPLQALGEGALQGVEALQASRAGRGADALHAMQVQNLQSEIARRNAETEALLRKTAAMRKFYGTPEGGEPVSSDATVAPPPTTAPVTTEAPEVPNIVEGKPATPEAEISTTEAPPPKGNVVSADPYDAEVARLRSTEQQYRSRARRAQELGIPEEGKDFEERADKLIQQIEKVNENKRKSLSEKVEETSPMGIYRQGQSAAMGASDALGNLKEMEQIIKDPKVDFGVLSPYITSAKSAVKQGEDYIPLLKSILPSIDTEALGKYERISSEGNKLVLAATNGKLGAGISNADVGFLKDTVFNPARTREYNMDVLSKQEALQKKVLAAAEEQERYKQERGGIDTNFQSHMAKWGIEHPVQSFMRKEAERRVSDIGAKEGPVARDRKIVKRGKSGDRPVVQYEDGTIEYAD